MNTNQNPPASVPPCADTISIVDLEVHYQVGVTEVERSQAQRLLVSIEMGLNFQRAAASDSLSDTIDYFSICQRVKRFGDGSHWELIETLAIDLAAMVLSAFAPLQVTVEVKKFAIPEARHVSVRTTKSRNTPLEDHAKKL
jgi:FolB domain-containing protein